MKIRFSLARISCIFTQFLFRNASTSTSHPNLYNQLDYKAFIIVIAALFPNDNSL